MLLNIPLAIWFGIATVISLFITFSFGIIFHYFKRPVFRYHKLFAFLTIALATIHTILAISLWFFGITI